MPSELEQAFEFMARADIGGTSTAATPFGVAVRAEEVPLRYDSNYLHVDRTTASAAELAAELERLGLRAALVRDEAAGTRLEPEFAALGWKTHRGVVMALHRRPEPRSDPGLASEVDEATLRPLRRRITLSYAWGTPELAEQLLQWKVLMARWVETRFFAVLVDGEVVAYADLYLGDGIAQIEDVVTAEQHRNRGYASAIVLRAIDEARQAGAELVFLVADADDWPKQLYQRLGFDPIGRYITFFA